jgi:mono/diheme cytochrome c family protein
VSFVGVFLLASMLSGCGAPEEPTAPLARAPAPGRPISMMALHATGGVPVGWRFTLPPGDPTRGRAAFVALGCNECHRVTPNDQPTGPGPALDGMGAHHSAEYFAESILNPDAVAVSGPGWLDANGRSAMPVYPDMTLAQLADLVAYVKSLDDGSHPMTPEAAPVRSDLPAPPPTDATRFLLQRYDIVPGRLADFEAWWASEGRAGFLAVDGVVALDTFVDRARNDAQVTTVVSFRDQAALDRFASDAAHQALGERFDAFVGPHGHQVFTVHPVHRVPSLSTP